VHAGVPGEGTRQPAGRGRTRGLTAYQAAPACSCACACAHISFTCLAIFCFVWRWIGGS